MVDHMDSNIDVPRGRGRPKNGAPLENSLWRLEEIIRRAAVKHDRLPPARDIADEMKMPTDAMAYHLLKLGEKRGLWRLIRPKLGFIEALAMDGSWRTATYDEWIAKNSKKRRCLSCRRKFQPKSKYIFRCDLCHAGDNFDFTHL